MATTEHILLTGATGNVGAVILSHLLTTTKHTVTIALRNTTSSVPFFEATYPSSIQDGRLKFLSIPDMTVSGVFDAPAAQATIIVHVATPLSNGNFVKEMIEPTWAVDKNVLEAAKKSGSVKRIVICGTILQALRPDTSLFAPDVTIDESRFNDIPFEASQDSWLPAYMYSKTNAEKKTWEWVAENKDSIKFDVVMLLPPMITGRSPQGGYKPDPSAPGGIGWIVKTLFTGRVEEEADGVFPYWMDTDDVAHCHILALDTHNVRGNERYLVAAPGILDIRKIINQLRGEISEIKERVPALKEVDIKDIESKLVKLDTSKADKVFGREWKSGYDSIKATAEDVLGWEKKNGVKVDGGEDWKRI